MPEGSVARQFSEAGSSTDRLLLSPTAGLSLGLEDSAQAYCCRRAGGVEGVGLDGPAWWRSKVCNKAPYICKQNQKRQSAMKRQKNSSCNAIITQIGRGLINLHYGLGRRKEANLPQHTWGVKLSPNTLDIQKALDCTAPEHALSTQARLKLTNYKTLSVKQIICRSLIMF